MELLSNQGRKCCVVWRGCTTNIIFLLRSSHTWLLGEDNLLIWTHVSICMDTCMDLEWYELRVPTLFSLRITEELIYLVGPKSSHWKAVPLRAACASKPKRAMAVPWLRERVAQWHGWYPTHKFSSFLKQSDPAYSSFSEEPLGWSFFQTTLKLCLRKHYLGQGKAVSLSIVTSRKDAHMPVFELGPGPFWVAGIAEINGISMVVTYLVCG